MLRIVLEFDDVEIAIISPQQMGLTSAPHSPNVLDCREYWVRLDPRTRSEKFVSSHISLAALLLCSFRINAAFNRHQYQGKEAGCYREYFRNARRSRKTFSAKSSTR
jgi:hypothetical protein